MAMTRKRLLQYGAAGGTVLFLPWAARTTPARAAMGGRLAKYIQPVPRVGAGIAVAQQSGSNHYAFTQTEIARQLHPDLPATPLWAYDDGQNGLGGQAGSFGTVVAAESGTAVTMSFTNNLPSKYPDWIPVDPRLTPFRNPDGSPQVRVMTHLHGGFVSGDSDGNPAATPDLFKQGQTQNVLYTNQVPEMPASLLWFHDHGLGTTRLNVFAGLAAGYVLRDEFDTGEAGNANGFPVGLGPDGFEVPLVIQDRQFNPDGTFLYPTSDIPGAIWIGEYFGDVMLVNGKVWPFLDVKPRLYRFRILNGCNSRIMNLGIGGARMWQIGAEGGLWDISVPVRQLVLAPAERADVLVDFSRLAGQTTVMTNGPLRSPVSNPAPQLPQVMQIRVANTTPITPTVPTTLIGGRQASLPSPVRSRFVTLNEVGPETAEWKLTLNDHPFLDNLPATETPTVGSVEEWYYINLTEDTHPMHTHLVTFQVIRRFQFDAAAYAAAVGLGPNGGVPGGTDPTPFRTGPDIPADPTERGFKDTVKANPGQVTVIRAKFDLPSGVTPPQRYVHHCHIVEHEDNDMMVPYVVS
jgi:spore coat protein A, manganese oxidase